MSKLFYKFEVQHTITGNNVRSFADSIKALPTPIVTKGEYLKSLENSDLSDLEKISIEGSVITSEKEYNILGGDGKYTKRETDSYPVQCVGKLISESGSSSGSMISRKLVLTTAHCVFPRGGINGLPYKNLKFQPGHPDHNIWYNIKTVYVDAGWALSGLYNSDLAICVVEQKMGINNFWGIQTIAGESKHGWTIYGYPAKGVFKGKYPYMDGGPSTFEPWEDGSLKFNLIAVDHIDLTAGGSGGPWIINGRSSIGNFVINGHDERLKKPFHINGITSFQFDEYPGIKISPYFGASAEAFFKAVLADI